jgi:putative phage-type endonuclease
MTINDTLARITEFADPIMDTRTATRAEWLVARKLGIGGSDAAGSIGLSPWTSQFSLWCDKTSDFVSDEDNRLMQWGRRLEGAIIEGFAEDTGIAVQRHPVMLRSKEYPFMVVNLDAVADDGVIEAKNVGHYMASEWEDGAVPAHYGIQGQHALAVTGLDSVTFAALVGGNDPRYVHVERNDALIERLIEGEQKFWEMVENMEPPDVDGSSATTQALKAMFVDPEAETIADLSDVKDHTGRTVSDLLAMRAICKAAIKEQEESIKEIENQLFLWLGNCEIAQVDGMTAFTWKKQYRQAYTVQATSFRKIHVPKPKKVKIK